jgi:antitoxin component YwqK of YwqJK toxin-antitoxin module
MKLIKVLCITLFFIQAKAQVKVSTTTYEGRSVFVYPYRVDGGAISSDNRLLGLETNLDVPYCPLQIPDGEYIAYYTKTEHYDKMMMPVYLKGDTDNLAIHFFIQSGRKEGKATWFSPAVKEKKEYLNGYYTADVKSGTWRYSGVANERIYKEKRGKTITRYGSEKVIFNYSNGLLDGEARFESQLKHTVITCVFKQGILDGKYSLFDQRTKDIIELEYRDGALHGAYHAVTHNGTINDVRIFRQHYRKPDTYKLIEVTGSLFKGLRYGTWEIKIDGQKFVLVYDTLKTVNVGGYVSYMIPGDYSESRERIPVIKYPRSPYLTDARNYFYMNAAEDYNKDWAWRFGEVIEDGAGYFQQFDKYGALINADSFYNGSLKIPFSVKDEKGNVLADCRAVPGNDKMFVIKRSSPARTEDITFIINDSDRVNVSSRTTVISKKKKEDTYHWDKAYYTYYHLTDAEIIAQDSQVTTYSKGSPVISVQYIHVPSSFCFTTYFHGREGYRLEAWNFDSIGGVLRLLREENIDKLTIVDTIIRKVTPEDNYFSTNDHLLWYHWQYYYRFNHNDYGKVFKDTSHTAFYWDGKPLTGDLTLNVREGFLGGAEMVREKIEKDGFRFGNNLSLEGTVSSYSIMPFFNFSYNDNPPKTITLHLEKGRMSGYQAMGIKSINGGFLVFCNVQYDASMKNGYEEKYHYQRAVKKVKRYRLKKLIHPRRRIQKYRESYQASGVVAYADKVYYVDGRPEGTVIIKGSGGEPDYLAQYKEGMLNGEIIAFNSHELPSIRCHFRNDTLHGLYEDYNEQNQRINEATFNRGVIDGRYYQYQYVNTNGNNDPEVNGIPVRYCDARKVNTTMLKFSNGYLVDTAKYFHCDGILKATIVFDIKDSVQLLWFTRTNGHTMYQVYDDGPYSRNGYSTTSLQIKPGGRDFLYSKVSFGFYSNLPGYYKYYYKSGVQSQEGRIDPKGLKTGWWKFWNENGVLMKEIMYEKGYIMDPVKGTDTVKYTGRIKGYYPNGKFMMEGYVLDEDLKYECVQDEEIAYQDVYYTRFYDENGNDIFKDYSGIVRDYSINGNKRNEGQIVKGERNGLWKSYENNGNLKSIGSYRNGLKDGTWITGDLSGIGFVDNQCFDGVIDIQRIRGNLNDKHLEFTEEIFSEGHLIKITFHKVKLD